MINIRLSRSHIPHRVEIKLSRFKLFGNFTQTTQKKWKNLRPLRGGNDIGVPGVYHTLDSSSESKQKGSLSHKVCYCQVCDPGVTREIQPWLRTKLKGESSLAVKDKTTSGDWTIMERTVTTIIFIFTINKYPGAQWKNDLRLRF
ncbi:unnamed protein product [Caretta caretta]